MAFFKNVADRRRGARVVLTGILEYSAGSYVGSRRKNQDNFRVGRRVPFVRSGVAKAVKGVICLRDMDLFCVCDGIGGGYRGELAAKYAMKAVKRYMKKTPNVQRPLREILLEAAHSAQSEVCAFYETMQSVGGSTLSMIALRGDQYAYLNIGDSPGFLIPHDGRIFELSQRHNLACEKLRMNLPAERSDSNQLLHYLGMEGQRVENIAYVTEGRLEVGDRILLCTDGVTNVYSPQSLEAAVRGDLTAGLIAKAAAQSKDADNCTAVCLTVRQIIKSAPLTEAENTAD